VVVVGEVVVVVEDQADDDEKIEVVIRTGDEDDAMVEVVKKEIEGEVTVSSEVVDFNNHAVFLHIMGDTLGSLVVLAVGMAIKWGGDGIWRFYLDPVASMLIVVLIAMTSGKLMWSCIKLLLHQTPIHLDRGKVLEEIKGVDGVAGVHEFHVWSFDQKVSIASLHLRIIGERSTNVIIGEVKDILHRHEIHSSTIQPESMGEEQVVCLDPRCRVDCGEYRCCDDDDPGSSGL